MSPGGDVGEYAREHLGRCLEQMEPPPEPVSNGGSCAVVSEGRLSEQQHPLHGMEVTGYQASEIHTAAHRTTILVGTTPDHLV